MFGWMMPNDSRQLTLSHFNFLGIGPKLLRKNIRDQHQPTVEEMWQSVLDLGAEIYVCTATLEIMGMAKEEFKDIPNVKYCGAVKFLEIAQSKKTAFFI
jgi:peroxiredoxin family protein